ncbi:hypothetical protein SARC_17191, partial [Sphaeroforma arctica JP610]
MDGSASDVDESGIASSPIANFEPSTQRKALHTEDMSMKHDSTGSIEPKSLLTSDSLDRSKLQSAAHVGVSGIALRNRMENSGHVNGLEGLGVDVYDHEAMEKNIMNQMDTAIQKEDMKLHMANMDE